MVIELDPSALAAVRTGRQEATRAKAASKLVGESGAWRDLDALVRRVAPTRLPILFLGEPGCGKTALARHAHEVSEVGGDFSVHDAAMVRTEGSDVWLRALRARLGSPAGTVFLRHLALLDGPTADGVCGLLDGMAEKSPRLMASAMVQSDPDLQPLFDRLGVIRVTIPPLRQRPEDIRALAGEFARRFAPRAPAPRFAAEAVQALLRLDWPGNVRQLENMVRGLVSGGRGGDIQLSDLPEDVRSQTSRRQLSRLEQMELDQILLALRQSAGNKLEAAKALGISRATLYRKLRAFGIELERSMF